MPLFFNVFSNFLGSYIAFSRYAPHYSCGKFKIDSPYQIEYGYCAVEKEYNSNGQIINETYYDNMGMRTCREFGYAGVRKQYVNNQLESEQYYDESGAPVNNCWNYASMTREFDESENNIRESYQDKDGNITDTSSTLTMTET